MLKSTGTGAIIPAKPTRMGQDIFLPIRIQQPTALTIDFLTSLNGCLICRCDIAVDLICACKEEAAATALYLKRSVLQKWHGIRRRNDYQNTVYWSAKANTSRNIVLYADKVSKISGEPCAHLELRFLTAAACRRAGIIEPRSLLQDIDVMRLIKHQTRLVRVDKARFDRLTEAVARNQLRRRAAQRRVHDTRVPTVISDQFKTVDGLSRRTGGLFCRMLGAENYTGINAQELVERLPMMRPSLRPLDWEQTIPKPQWMLLP